MIITRTSMLTGIERALELPVTQEQLDNWKKGTLSQNAFPGCDADQREFIQTGMTPSEWDKAFGVEEL